MVLGQKNFPAAAYSSFDHELVVQGCSHLLKMCAFCSFISVHCLMEWRAFNSVDSIRRLFLVRLVRCYHWTYSYYRVRFMHTDGEL